MLDGCGNGGDWAEISCRSRGAQPSGRQIIGPPWSSCFYCSAPSSDPCELTTTHSWLLARDAQPELAVGMASAS